MKITIGGQDYTAALDAVHPLILERKLNEPSTCQLWLTMQSNESTTPFRNQSVRIDGDNGTCYFSGYVAATPMPEYAGLALEGSRYRFAIQAISDEYLLDQLGLLPSNSPAGMNAGPLIALLAAKTGSDALSTQGLLLDAPITSFAARTAENFSRAVARVAGEARSAYRAMGNALSLTSIPAAVHLLDETNGSLALENLALTAGTKRALANDITVCGEHEPTEYVTEYFVGDGVTTEFYLTSRPYMGSSEKTTIIRELFNESQIDPRHWSNSGSSGYISLGSAGLSMQGGTGRDGQVELTWLDPVEMGGTLLLYAGGVTLGSGGTGVIAGFFTGEQKQEACTAGFQVTSQQGTGTVSVQPLVLGSPAGSLYQINPSNQYAMRIRIHCPECQRGLAVYRSYGDSGAIASGGQWNTAPAQLQFEIQEFVNGVAGMPVTLYEGRITSLPGTCMVVPASSINLTGTMRSFNLANLGSAWVVTAADGSTTTRRVGTTAQAAECQVESSGKLVFYPGFTPSAGDLIAVSYRALGRAVGRAVNTASQEALAQAGLADVSSWTGTVTNPAPRCSQDCRNAAYVLEQAAASASALWAGSYECTGAGLDADIWPGDALKLNIPSANLSAQVVVRTVKLSYGASYPDLVSYAIGFANDWANDLAIKTNETVPADAWLPVAIAPTYAPNLSGFAIIGISGADVTINTGASAPTGGGFEIRRRDNCFMPGDDPDLVMRSSEPTMTFTRRSASERFYLRAFDGSNPPNYSEFSATLILNLPLAS